MRILRPFLPRGRERRLLGRFYLSCVVAEVLNVVQPFLFVYLLLVLDRPEWAAIPLAVSSLVAFGLEIPTGVVADRWGRKASVVLGDVLSGLGWAIVPVTALVHGPLQLAVACLAFGLDGLGRTLVSGAEEAWIVDNLLSTGDEQLTAQYFARERSLASIGGVAAGLAVWILLLSVPVGAALLAGLWLAAASGQFLSAAILSGIPELRPPAAARDAVGPDAASVGKPRRPLRAVLHVKPLVAFLGVLVVATFSASIFQNAFDISLITRGLNPRELAPLGIAADLIGFVAPLGCLALTRRLGHHRTCAALLLLTAAASLLFFADLALSSVVGLFLFFTLMDHLYGPVARTIRQAYIPSPVRATASSIANQASELARTLGLATFALLLGRHGAELQAAMPGLVEAFAGQAAPPPSPPAGTFGLPVADGAIVLFALAGTLAAALLLLFPWRRQAPDGPTALVLSGAGRVHR